MYHVYQLPRRELENPETWLSSIKSVFIDIFEEEDDLQVKSEITTQLVALDEEIFISFLNSRGKDVRELVLQEIVNNPRLVEKTGEVDFLECYLAESEPDLQSYYHSIFDQIDRESFQPEEIDRKIEYVIFELEKADESNIRKVSRLSGLLLFAEGLDLCSTDYLETGSDHIVDILWMKKRLIKSGNRTRKLEDDIEIKQLSDLIARSILDTESETQAFEYLTALGDVSPNKRDIYSFFDSLMYKSDYRKQIRLLNGLVDAKSNSADILLCNALSNSMYDSVREKAACLLARREKLLCIETIRNIINSDPDFEVRMHAIKIIADKGGASDAKYLLKAVFDPDRAVSKTAIDCLADTELDEESTAVILDIIKKHGDINWKLKALRLLLKTKLKNIHTAEILIETLEKADQTMKAAVISIVGQYREFRNSDNGSSILDRIREVLEYNLVNDSFFETRAEAAMSLGKLGIETSIPLLIERFIQEEDFEVKRGIMLSLVELESTENRIIDYYRNILSNPGNCGKRELLLALEGSGMMKTTGLLGLVITFFSNDDYFLRWQSVVSSGEIIEDMTDIESLPAGFSTKLFAIIQNDNLPTIRAAACWAVSRNMALLQLEETVDLLIKSLKDEDSMVREIAAESLGNYRSPLNRAIPELIKIIKEEIDPSVRYCSVHSLGCIARSIRGRQIAVKKPKMKIERD